ncbi:hypothetical protein ACTFIR_001607 [Dictyostelium discoideum]
MIDFKKLMLEEKKKLLLEKQQKEKQDQYQLQRDKEKEDFIDENDKQQQQQIKDNKENNIKNDVEFDQQLYEENLIIKLKQYKFGSIDSIFYIEDFINKQEEETILSNVYNKENDSKWTQLKKRRLQNWGGNPISSGMIEEEIPQWLNIICEKIHNSSIFPTRNAKPNHVLLNEYNVNEGIMPHKDGPLFFPMVCILSLNSTCLMDFYNNLKEEPFEKIFLRPRSLLIFTEDAYKNYFHGIKESYSDLITEDVMNKNLDGINLHKEFDRGIRVSLTIRIVPNTIKKEK